MAPNKKKRTKKKKKAENQKPDARTAVLPSSVPQEDETTARLSLELEALKQEVNTLSRIGATGGVSLETRKRLGEKQRELFMHQEELRWRETRQVFDELYRLPLSEADAQYSTEECPICSEAIPVRPLRHACCGQIECRACASDFNHGELERLNDWLLNNEEGYEELSVDEKTRKFQELMGKKKSFLCIFCGQRTPANDAEHRECVETAAEQGKAWAQEMLSDILFKEGKTKEGLVWLRKAVAQEYAPAELSMGTRLVDQDKKEAMRLMKVAAYKGDAIAQCVYGKEILEENGEEAILLLTLSALRGVSLAQVEMATKFGGMHEPKEQEVGIYWYEKAAQQGDALSQNQLALLLITRAERVFGSCGYPGYSPIPQAYRWNCRSLQGGYRDAARVAQLFERMFFSSCAVCGRSQQEFNRQFLACSKCKAFPYCSKTCQKIHWRDGHKHDCCDNAEPLSN